MPASFSFFSSFPCLCRVVMAVETGGAVSDCQCRPPERRVVGFGMRWVSDQEPTVAASDVLALDEDVRNLSRQRVLAA